MGTPDYMAPEQFQNASTATTRLMPNLLQLGNERASCMSNFKSSRK